MAGTAMFVFMFTLLLYSASPSVAQLSELCSTAHSVNLTDLLTFAGPFQTFLGHLIDTRAIDTFQNRATNTKVGITIFCPTNSAFQTLEHFSVLPRLTKDQLKSLLLFHALPQYYSLSEFQNLSSSNPVTTFAGKEFTLNITDSFGNIRLDTGWTKTSISSSVYASNPVALYQIDAVLLPKAIFGTRKAPPPPPRTPAPGSSPSSEEDPLGPSRNVPAPQPSPPSNSDFSSYMTGFSVVNYLALVISVALMVIM